MKKESIIIISIAVIAMFLYGLTLRGAPGNPTPADFPNNLDQQVGAFELSPERGRYVHVANMAEVGRYDLEKKWADIAYPDVGKSRDGRYYSYFAPGVPYMVLPLYIIGAKYGYAQLATFTGPVLVSLVTLIFIYLISRNIFGLPRSAAILASLIFGFASNAWGYSATLYQHAFTTCFIVTGYYAVWKFRQKGNLSWLYASWAWAAYALAVFVDYPNAVLMLPVMIYFAVSTFSLEKKERLYSVKVRWSAIITFAVFVVIMGLHFFHNAYYLDSWKQLSGGLPRYERDIERVLADPTLLSRKEVIDRLRLNGVSLESIASSTALAALVSDTDPTSTATTAVSTIKDKNVIGFFDENRVIKGLKVLLVSLERGLFFFFPVFILSIFGILMTVRKKGWVGTDQAVPIFLIAVSLLLYSSWGDPWGGWAYGPRYLIPSAAWLAIFATVFVSGKKFSLIRRISAFVLFMYSSAIALLGALTTNAVPPMSEALLLPIKKFNYLLNIDLIAPDKSGSFLYTSYFSEYTTLLGYFLIIWGVVVLLASLLLFIFNSKKP